MVEESKHDRSVEISQVELIGSALKASSRERQQELPGVSVGCDSAWRNATLTRQTIQEVLVQKFAKLTGGANSALHGCPPCLGARQRERSAAMASSSGIPDRYQKVSVTLPWPR